jgi:hypothetical protein
VILPPSRFCGRTLPFVLLAPSSVSRPLRLILCMLGRLLPRFQRGLLGAAVLGRVRGIETDPAQAQQPHGAGRGRKTDDDPGAAYERAHKRADDRKPGDRTRMVLQGVAASKSGSQPQQDYQDNDQREHCEGRVAGQGGPN